jgi:hypothetical protein
MNWVAVSIAVGAGSEEAEAFLGEDEEEAKARWREKVKEGMHVDGQEEGQKARAKAGYEECAREGVWYARWMLWVPGMTVYAKKSPFYRFQRRLEIFEKLVKNLSKSVKAYYW